MQYKDFVKSMFEKHRGKMAAKDIMKLAAHEWPAVRDSGKMPKMSKSKKGKAGNITGGNETGGSILGDILGFGMEKPKKTKAKRKSKQEKGAGIFSDLGSALGSIGAVMDPIVSIASGRKNVVGGSMGGKLEKNKVPKNPNPKRLSTFYNTENLPESNYQMKTMMPTHGGTLLMMNSGKAQPAGMAMGGMVTGGGILDNIMPLLPFAFL